MTERLTKPKPYDGTTSYGGVGVVARRQQDPVLSGLCDAASRLGISLFGQGWGKSGWGNLESGKGSESTHAAFSILSAMAETAPLRLLRLLMAQDGTAQMAQLTKASLAFGARKVRFVAVKDWRTGHGEIDDDGTMEIARVLALYGGESLGSVAGGLPLLLHASERLDDTGQVCFEAVGDVGTGITAIYDFDALNCRYRDGEGRVPGSGPSRMQPVRFFEQQQDGIRANDKIGQVDGWRLLTGPGIVSIGWKASSDNPYGIPAAGAALSYLLRKAARRREMSDWLHAVAWPKVIVEQAVTALYRLAAEQPGVLFDTKGIQLSPDEWVSNQIALMQSRLAGLKSDDVWMIGEGKAYSINPSGIQGLTDVLTMERLEEIQSYNLLPGLLGVTDGGTQAYAEVQWLAQVQSLALHAAYAAAPAVALGNYHFRLLGQDMIVRAEFDSLPPINPQAAAESRRTIMAIEEHLAIIGVNGPDDFAMRASEGGAADPALLEGYLAAMLAQISAGGTVPGTGA